MHMRETVDDKGRRNFVLTEVPSKAAPVFALSDTTYTLPRVGLEPTTLYTLSDTTCM